MSESLARLPKEPADRLTRPFLRFLRIEAMAGVVLLLSTVLALVIANTAWSASFLALWDMPAGIRFGEVEVSRSLRHWINDGLMTLFFFVIALELKRELVLGELRNPRVAALPVAAAFGGMVVPAGVFLLVIGSSPGANGWGIVMSTDTAFVIGCLAMLGSRIPESLRLFLLSLAIFDDVGAILVVAIGYGGTLNWAALGAAGIGLAVVAAISRLGVRNIPVYFAVGGGIWLAFDTSGVHATVTGVILGLMTPARSWVSDTRLHAILDRVVAYPPGDHWSGDAAARGDLHRAGVATREVLSPIERLEIALHPWVAFAIMPLFALANAGVPMAAATFDAALTTAIVAAFVVGKPAGVVLFSVLAVKLRLGIRPNELSWGLLAAGSLLTGIGFTMALFIAELAFEPTLLDSVKLGILGASIISAAAGFLALNWLTSRRTPWRHTRGS
ncbi:Na+/H+ antiporter NhaA [Ancylobacter sp. Lp-2]|uniref:Na+/H+ antiporter NhaA n=1 Tax=Ancylobacter sp. Lp-2 TaxID=2881339 RepID=UPI001E455A4F|nr:Na+/H+ antiporter NhaA [Ancylobacter sp. Lp-2]MCB4767301.1 Na+/H+ antiporter NhaA [Ancylobacter sp. Lp-2]